MNMKYISLFIYKVFLIYLPPTSFPILGKPSKILRGYFCKKIFRNSGKSIDIERGVVFGNGFNIIIGSNSGLGKYCYIPSDISIGDNVMMGPNVLIISENHNYSDTKIPMNMQGISKKGHVIIEDDVWIGARAIITEGRIIKRGTIIAAGTVLTKDFPEFSIIGGNPGRLIKSRNEINT